MITPPYLQPGDKIAVIAASGKLAPGSLEYAIQVIEGWGFEVVLGKYIYNNTHSYLAGNDQERLADLQWALNDLEIKGILCARGGYGVTRIIDQVDFTVLKKHPKWLAGFSDVTALLGALFSNGLESIHATMPKLFGKEGAEPSLESLRRLLLGNSVSIKAEINRSNRLGEAVGNLVGGNLSLLTDSIGTAYEFDTENKILVIEEVEEASYKIDRMMTQLKRSGKLSLLKGLVVGYITEAYKENNFRDTIEEIILDKVDSFTYPVAFDFPCGHAEPNIAFRHGADYKLMVADDEVILTINQPAV